MLVLTPSPLLCPPFSISFSHVLINLFHSFSDYFGAYFTPGVQLTNGSEYLIESKVLVVRLFEFQTTATS